MYGSFSILFEATYPLLFSHITHHVLGLWFLGAPKAVIEEAYKRSSTVQTPAFESPEKITPENFITHLGDRR